ncbi:hypothetical protein B5F07_02385 [Lachnoclostridium sp. An169]|nr:hypothetical protein B5F07_02385 [Lachnoclostridium sp. An169]
MKGDSFMRKFTDVFHSKTITDTFRSGMKKAVCAFVLALSVFALTACGEPEEVKAAKTATLEQNGVTMKMIFDARGDRVTRLTQESSISLEGYTEDQLAELDSAVEAAQAAYSAIEGVEYSAEKGDGYLTETIVIPTDEDTLKTVIGQGLLPVDDEDLTQLSLDATVENLESAGWTVE